MNESIYADNQSVVCSAGTKYIVTEHYGDKIELKDAIISILHSQYKDEKNKKKTDETPLS